MFIEAENFCLLARTFSELYLVAWIKKPAKENLQLGLRQKWGNDNSLTQVGVRELLNSVVSKSQLSVEKLKKQSLKKKIKKKHLMNW